MDYTSKCPIEWLALCFSYTSNITELIQYSTVSRHWNNAITIPLSWSNTIYNCNSTNPNHSIYTAINHFPYIAHLTSVIDNDNISSINNRLLLRSKWKFTMLRVCILYSNYIDSLLIHSITNNSRLLEIFDLRGRGITDNLNLLLLSNLSNLSSLVLIINPSTVTAADSNTNNAILNNTIITVTDLHQLLLQLNQLKVLYIDIPDIILSDTLLLLYNNTSNHSNNPSNSNTNNTNTELIQFQLLSTPYGLSPTVIDILLSSNSNNNLQQLYLSPYYQYPIDQLLLMPMKFQNLLNLTIMFQTTLTATVLSQFKQFKQLSEFSLSRCSGFTGMELIDLLINLKNLRKLLFLGMDLIDNTVLISINQIPTLKSLFLFKLNSITLLGLIELLQSTNSNSNSNSSNSNPLLLHLRIDHCQCLNDNEQYNELSESNKLFLYSAMNSTIEYDWWLMNKLQFNSMIKLHDLALLANNNNNITDSNNDSNTFPCNWSYNFQPAYNSSAYWNWYYLRTMESDQIQLRLNRLDKHNIDNNNSIENSIENLGLDN